MTTSRVARAALALGGLVLWLVVALALIDDATSAVVLWVLVVVGPAWAYALCVVSEDEDFTIGAGRSRSEWLRLLPWTFVLAPFVVPTLVLLAGFFRDARADGGRTWLGSGRSRPGEDQEVVR